MKKQIFIGIGLILGIILVMASTLIVQALLFEDQRDDVLTVSIYGNLPASVLDSLTERSSIIDAALQTNKTIISLNLTRLNPENEEEFKRLFDYLEKVNIENNYGSEFRNGDFGYNGLDVVNNATIGDTLTASRICLSGDTCQTSWNRGGQTASAKSIIHLWSGQISLVTDYYIGVGYADTIESDAWTTIPSDITVTKINCRVEDNAGSDRSVFTLRDDSLNTALTCDTGAGGNSCTATSNGINIASGSLISILHDEIAGTTGGSGGCSIEYSI